MKAGKSSLVNAVVFGDEILPSGVAPSTVTLTEISYSEEEKAVVNLLSNQDVEDLKKQAAYNGNDPVLKVKAEAAAHTLDSFTSGYEKYLNLSEQTINLSSLHEYIDAKGKYSGLAKSVKIFINNESLKGITIIDTPGFNDSIVSRGETTKRALSQCHVLLFVHNKDGYDESDISLLVEQIEYAGISEIIDILNKVDMLGVPIAEWPEELDYFIQKRDEMKVPNSNVKTLISNSHATFVSSLMALCGLIPYDKMSDDMKSQFSGYEEDFEELCQPCTKEEQQKAFVKYSNVNSIINEVNRLAKEGSVYLVEGPLMTLKGKLLSIKAVVESEIEAKRASLNSLEVSVETSKKSLEKFEDFMSSVMSKVQSSSLISDLSNLISSTIRKAQDLRQSESSKEFTEERYPDPSFGSRGVGKANIANYNTFVSGFESSLRDLLNNLKDSFSSVSKNEINSIITSLSSTSHIDKERMESLKKSLVNSIQNSLNDIYVIVPSKRLSNLPDGNQKQWDKLRTHFLDVYNDKYLCDMNEGIFSYFSQAIQGLDYVSIAIKELDKLRNDIIDSMKKTPQQKKKDMEQLEMDIKLLESELSTIKSDITSIEELTNNVKSNV